MFKNFWGSVHKTLIYKNNYKIYVEGLKNTLIISLFAVIIGLIVGSIVAIIRYNAHSKSKKNIFSIICDFYVTIVRGTPVTVQLLILYFVVFSAVTGQKVLIACIAFGLNSGAYVSEIIRGGILAIDKGQMEAGLSLGLSRRQCMLLIILPQVLKNTLPSIFNEFIALIKETSVASFIGITDLTFAGKLMQSSYAEAFVPLLVTAIIYLILVYTLTFVLKKLERRLSKSDRS